MKQYIKTLSKEELDSMIQNDSLSILFFTADWCNPCKTMYPVCERLDEKKDVEIVKINVSDLDEDDKFIEDVKVLPTFILFKNGTKLVKISGAAEDALLSMTEKYVNYKTKKS